MSDDYVFVEHPSAYHDVTLELTPQNAQLLMGDLSKHQDQSLSPIGQALLRALHDISQDKRRER